MKPLFCVLLGLVSASIWAQAPGEAAATRERISSARSVAEVEFAAQEKACYQRFAVNDCLHAARAKRRAALADLRREEIALDDADRQRRAAERLHTLEERAAERAEVQDPARAGEAAARQQSREAAAAQKQAARPAATMPSPGAPAAPAAPASTTATSVSPASAPMGAPAAHSSAAKPAAPPRPPPSASLTQAPRQQQRLEEAQARKERVARKLAERTKPPAAPLPTP